VQRATSLLRDDIVSLQWRRERRLFSARTEKQSFLPARVKCTKWHCGRHCQKSAPGKPRGIRSHLSKLLMMHPTPQPSKSEPDPTAASYHHAPRTVQTFPLLLLRVPHLLTTFAITGLSFAPLPPVPTTAHVPLLHTHCLLGISLSTNTDYLPKRYEPVRLCNSHAVCFLWGRSWLFMYMLTVKNQNHNSKCQNEIYTTHHRRQESKI
jgi:hypothetical protein